METTLPQCGFSVCLPSSFVKRCAYSRQLSASDITPPAPVIPGDLRLPVVGYWVVVSLSGGLKCFWLVRQGRMASVSNAPACLTRGRQNRVAARVLAATVAHSVCAWILSAPCTAAKGGVCRWAERCWRCCYRGVMLDAVARAMHVHDTLALDRAHETKGKMVAR